MLEALNGGHRRQPSLRPGHRARHHHRVGAGPRRALSLLPPRVRLVPLVHLFHLLTTKRARAVGGELKTDPPRRGSLDPPPAATAAAAAERAPAAACRGRGGSPVGVHPGVVHVLRGGASTRLRPRLVVVDDALVVLAAGCAGPGAVAVHLLPVGGVLLALGHLGFHVVLESPVVPVLEPVRAYAHGVVVLHDLVAILKLGHHLVPLLASPDVRPHVLDRLLGDRLEEVILGAEPYAVHDGVRVLVRGHHHHRHLLVEGVVANVVQERRAVDVGHHDVGEEEVELGAALQEGHRLLAAARRGDCDGLGDAFGDGRVSRNAVRARARGGSTAVEKPRRPIAVTSRGSSRRRARGDSRGSPW